MNFFNISDCHNHSNCSFDGHNSILELCKKAEELKLLYIAITDHCECNQYNDTKHNYKTSSKKAHEQMLKYKKDFPNMLMGIELGQPLQNLEAANEVLQSRDYDFVLASLHNLSGLDDFYFWSDVEDDYEKYLSAYLKQLKDMVLWGKFDSLAHLSYPLRYIKTKKGEKITFDNFHEEISEIYKIMIEKNIALEINCSGKKQENGILIPDLPLIKLYKSLGGKLVTLGSDSHKVEYLSIGIEDGLKTLLEAGFTQYTVFINRKPVMIDIK